MSSNSLPDPGCEVVQRVLAEATQLGGKEGAAIRQHLNQCPACRAIDEAGLTWLSIEEQERLEEVLETEQGEVEEFDAEDAADDAEFESPEFQADHLRYMAKEQERYDPNDPRRDY